MIDWDKVRDLQQDVGAEDFDEIVELFLEEVGEMIDKLSSFVDRNTLAADLHFLKGSASNLGFTALVDLCRSGEKAAEDGNAETVDVGQIRDTYELSKQCFIKELSTLRAA